MDLGRGAIAQRLMHPPVVVEVKVLAQALAGFPRVAVVVPVDFLVLDRPPQPLDKDVVQSSAFAVLAGTPVVFTDTGVRSPLVSSVAGNASPTERHECRQNRLYEGCAI